MVPLLLKRMNSIIFGGVEDSSSDTSSESTTSTKPRKRRSSKKKRSKKKDNASDDHSSSPTRRPAHVECPPIPLHPERRGNEIAVVACGCFWNPQQRFERVRVAYRCCCSCCWVVVERRRRPFGFVVQAPHTNQLNSSFIRCYFFYY
jgi:hypothetical protein